MMGNTEFTVRLSRDEESALVANMRAGDEQAKQRLVESQIPWMYKLARKLSKRPQDVDDLRQVGVESLYESLKQFDPAVARLTTYAAWLAKRRMRRWINANESCVSRSQNPSRKDPQRWKQAGSVGELLDYDGDWLDAEQAVEDTEELIRLRLAIDALPPREREIVHRRCSGETLQHIAASLGITRERVRQIEYRAIENLRASLVGK